MSCLALKYLIYKARVNDKSKFQKGSSPRSRDKWTSLIVQVSLSQMTQSVVFELEKLFEVLRAEEKH